MMPRDGNKVRLRLQESALQLCGEQGYDQTTTAEIAARAGVTERTFFRHFPDKREVLFDGERAFGEILLETMRRAPTTLDPWATLFHTFRAAKDLLTESRHFGEPRRRIIASSSQLQERELMKIMSLNMQLARGLQERGIPSRLASLSVQVAMAAFSQAFSSWLEDPAGELDEHLARSFREVNDLSSTV